MSQEILLSGFCPHIIKNEKVSLVGSDRRTFNLSLPMVDSRQVQVKVNGVNWPPMGIQLPAQVYGAASSPFKVSTPLPVTVNEKPLTVPAGVYSCTQLVDLINSARVGGSKLGILAENVSGFLVLTDSSGRVGPSTPNSLSGTLNGGSTLKVIGLSDFGVPDGSYEGRTIYPGWYSASTETYGFISLSSAMLSNPIVTVDYPTSKKDCLRCMGSGVENDYNFDKYGNIILISDENLLYQAVMKILLTDAGSNPYHTWYGSSLKSRIGTKNVAVVLDQIKADIKSSLINLQDLQKRQRTYQDVSLKEFLYSISNIQVEQDADNPQLFNITVEVQNASFGEVSINIFYTAAEVSARISGSQIQFGV